MKKIREQIELLYNFKAVSVECFKSSDDNSVYKMRTEKGKFCVRIGKRKGKDIDESVIELRFLQYLKSIGCPVAGVIPTKGGELVVLSEVGVMTVFEWIDGDALSPSLDHYPTEAQAHNAGGVLADIHKASFRYEIVTPPKRKLTSELERILELKEKVLARYSNGEEFLANVSELIEFSVNYGNHNTILIHNDFRPQNVLFGDDNCKDNVLGVIDFDWICVAPTVKDLALALVEWSFVDGDVAACAKVLRAFLSGYLEKMIDEESMPSLDDLSRWVRFACFSEVATYVADKIDSEGRDGDFPVVHSQELRSYMLRKARYFESIDLKKLTAGI